MRDRDVAIKRRRSANRSHLREVKKLDFDITAPSFYGYTEADAHLMRGVRSKTVLSNFGQFLNIDRGSDKLVGAPRLDASRGGFSAFISHSWRTWWFTKWMVILIELWWHWACLLAIVITSIVAFVFYCVWLWVAETHVASFDATSSGFWRYFFALTDWKRSTNVAKGQAELFGLRTVEHLELPDFKLFQVWASQHSVVVVVWWKQAVFQYENVTQEKGTQENGTIKNTYGSLQ